MLSSAIDLREDVENQTLCLIVDVGSGHFIVCGSDSWWSKGAVNNLTLPPAIRHYKFHMNEAKTVRRVS